MAAGDRRINGKPKDIVRHFGLSVSPICGTKGFGYVSADISEVSCIKCKAKIIKNNIWYPGK